MLLRYMKYFQAVVEENSFTEAAEKCYISQSGISQGIKALEEEVGAQLIIRKNRSFELTEAGKYFYRESLVITGELEALCRETARIANKDAARLSIGCLSTFSGNEWGQAVARFAEKFPEVELAVSSGNHEDLFQGMQTGKIDLALNDQRRAFSDAFENLILKETICYVEMASFHPLAKQDAVSVDGLKNTPCILVASKEQEEEEQHFYHDIIGFEGDFIFARTLQEAHVMVVANRGVLPIEGNGGEDWFGASMKRLPLTRGGEPIRRRYCAFWKKDNSGYYVEEFAGILKSQFPNSHY